MRAKCYDFNSCLRTVYGVHRLFVCSKLSSGALWL